MYTGKSYKLLEFLNWTRRDICVLILLGVVPVVAYQIGNIKWLGNSDRPPVGRATACFRLTSRGLLMEATISVFCWPWAFRDPTAHAPPQRGQRSPHGDRGFLFRVSKKGVATVSVLRWPWAFRRELPRTTVKGTAVTRAVIVASRSGYQKKG